MQFSPGLNITTICAFSSFISRSTSSQTGSIDMITGFVVKAYATCFAASNTVFAHIAICQ